MNGTRNRREGEIERPILAARARKIKDAGTGRIGRYGRQFGSKSRRFTN